MTSRVNEPSVKNKDLSCAFLSCIPVFGFFGFLFMGKKTDRKQLTAIGRIYAWLSLVPFAAVLLAELLFWTGNEFFDGYGAIRRWMETAGEYILLTSVWVILPVWIICCIHTLSQLGTYRQYLYIKERSTPERNPLVHNRKWRKENLAWMRWNWVPVWGGLALWFAGKQMQAKKIQKYGISAFCVTFVLGILEYCDRVFWVLRDESEFYAFVDTIICFLWILTAIISFMVREDYLDARVKRWEQDIQQQPLLRDRKWCCENSRWKLWTYFPYVGGVGFILAGGKSGIRKHSLLGTAMCILNAIVLVATFIMGENYAQEGFLMMCGLGVVLYIFGIFYGQQIRWQTLKSRARALKGYRSEFERELDMLERVQRRSAEVPEPVKEVPERKPVKEEPAEIPDVPVAKELPPEPARTLDTYEKIDINRCTQAELMQLPGMSVGQAKTAIEYRTEKGGFKSVDELIEVLQIKPHFAVQIFARTTVSEMKAPVKNSGAARRRIDL